MLNDGSYRLLDWNFVNTTVGACCEPRSISLGGTAKITTDDAVDSSFNKMMEFDEDAFYRTHGSGGRLRPIDFLY